MGGPLVGGFNQQASSQLELITKVKDSCASVFSYLRMHPNISLFIQPADLSNPRYMQLTNEYGLVNMNIIEANFKENKYQSTF
jgi:hypothetical protein